LGNINTSHPRKTPAFWPEIKTSFQVAKTTAGEDDPAKSTKGSRFLKKAAIINIGFIVS